MFYFTDISIKNIYISFRCLGTSRSPARGESVVIAMWSTGESVTEAVADRDGDRAAAAAGFASAPKEAPHGFAGCGETRESSG